MKRLGLGIRYCRRRGARVCLDGSAIPPHDTGTEGGAGRLLEDDTVRRRFLGKRPKLSSKTPYYQLVRIGHLGICPKTVENRSFSELLREQPFQVQEVARKVGLSGPFGSRLELDACKIADFPIAAIAHTADKFVVWAFPTDFRARRDGRLQLQARARGGNVLQESRRPPGSPGLVSPADFDHVRAHIPNL